MACSNDLCTHPDCVFERTQGYHPGDPLSQFREREGDQQLPVEGQQNVSEAVKADLDKRIALGIQRYGKPLQTFNGRDALQDAYEEALDLVHYLKQAILERDSQLVVSDGSTPTRSRHPDADRTDIRHGYPWDCDCHPSNS